MAKIRTVLGDKNPGELGVILPHEHTVLHFLGATVDHAAAYDRARLVTMESEELRSVREAHGISCIVDASPFDLGRDTGFQVDVSRRSGVYVVASTGFFTESMGFPSYWRQRDIDAMEEFYTKEITEGVVGTDVKCGVIKLATGPGSMYPRSAGRPSAGGARITAGEERAFRAAARVQRKLGVGIITHTEVEDWAIGNIGAEQLAILKQDGADPSHCAIGHASSTANLSFLVGIMNQGANVAFDTIGVSRACSEDVIAGVVIALVSMGYERQLLLSHDRYCMEVRSPISETDPAVYRTVHLSHIHREFVPRLLKGGVSESTIHQIMVENPRRLLAF